jgi:hypothetical protein
MEVFEHSGHIPFWDEPEKFFKVLKEFIKDLSETKSDDVSRWKKYVVDWEKEMEDPFLSAEMGEKESMSIEEFRRKREKIKQGEKFQDETTPLNAFLTLLSAMNSRDVERVIRTFAVDVKRLNIPVTEKYIVFMEQGFNQLDVLRAPLPPENPSEGDLWPVYMKHVSGADHKDTFLFAFVQGKWGFVGNVSNPADWRPAADRFKMVLKGKK